MKVDNAIIMAAGTSSRFAPLSYEVPKALINVKGEVLVERQIEQLKDAGIDDIIVVTGYKAEQFTYLGSRYGVRLVHNPDFLTRNNNSSIYVVKDFLKNSYICSADNYFTSNPFEDTVDESYYSAIYVDGKTDEWCISEEKGYITCVTVGGENSWIMMGHTFWSEEFSRTFCKILDAEYDRPETADKLWETIYLEHVDELPMRVKKYPNEFIFEFDTLDELRQFDSSYILDTRSSILKQVALRLQIEERDIRNISVFKDGNNAAAGFEFVAGSRYRYYYETMDLEMI